MLPRAEGDRRRWSASATTNWSIVPCPHPEWAKLVYPDLPRTRRTSGCGSELEHVLRLDEPDPVAAWEERMDTLNDSAGRLDERRFDAIELRGPGTELTVGMLPTHDWWAARLRDRRRHPAHPEPADRGGVHDARPAADGGPRDLDQAARAARRHDHPRPPRALRGRPRGRDRRGRERDALRSQLAIDEGAARLGELALVDRQGRIGPLGTVFYDTLLDENAASHIALGSGFPFPSKRTTSGAINRAGIHVDFMIGSPELEVAGVTAAGERVPVLRGGDWQTSRFRASLIRTGPVETSHVVRPRFTEVPQTLHRAARARAAEGDASSGRGGAGVRTMHPFGDADGVAPAAS